MEMLSHRVKVARQRREQAVDDVLALLELAIARARASVHAEPELKALIRGALEAARQELVHLKNVPERPTLLRYEDRFSDSVSPMKGREDLEKAGDVR